MTGVSSQAGLQSFIPTYFPRYPLGTPGGARHDRHDRSQEARQAALEHETRISELERAIRKDRNVIADHGLELRRLSLAGVSGDSDPCRDRLMQIMDAADRVLNNTELLDDERQALADAEELIV